MPLKSTSITPRPDSAALLTNSKATLKGGQGGTYSNLLPAQTCMNSALQTLSAIEDLVVGKGSRDLRTVEDRLKAFCPFEAVGMVRQEIRHSNFLAYILDPSRPHGLADALLQELLFEILEKGDETLPLRKLDLHFRPLGNARIYRETMNIDLLIEVPGSGSQKGLVIAIEMKVDAGESDNQLAKYEKRLRAAYSADRWLHVFGFLTVEGRPSSTAGETAWTPLSFTGLFKRFDATIRHHGHQGRGVEMYQDYAKMMRRNGMAEGEHDEQLQEAVRNLWVRHREALDYLMLHRPDTCDETMRAFEAGQAGHAERLSAVIGHRIAVDTAFRIWRRFWFPDLVERFPAFRHDSDNWVASRSLAVLEVHPERDQIIACIAVGEAGNDQAARRALLLELNRETGTQKKAADTGVRHYWRSVIATPADFSDESAIGRPAADIVAERLATYLQQVYPCLQSCMARTAVALTQEVGR